MVNCVVNTCIQWNLSIAVTHRPKICGLIREVAGINWKSSTLLSKPSSYQSKGLSDLAKKKMTSMRTHTTKYFPGDVCLPGAISLAVK